MDEIPARPRLLGALDVPEWLSSSPWRWVGHTTVLGGGSPDGRCVEYPTTGKPARHFELDIVLVDAVGTYEVSSLPDREAAHCCWEAGVVALASPDLRGAATLLLPGFEATPELMVEAFRRLALLLGANPMHVAVEIPVFHPRDHAPGSTSDSRIVLDSLPDRTRARALAAERYGLVVPQ